MANLKIAQPLLLSGPIQNRLKRLYFWLKFLSDLAKEGCSPQPSWLRLCLYSKCLNCMEAQCTTHRRTLKNATIKLGIRKLKAIRLH